MSSPRLTAAPTRDSAKFSDRRLVALLGGFLTPYWKQMVLVFLLLLIVTMMTALLPYLVQLVVDGPIHAGDLAGLYPYAATYFLAIFVLFGARFAHTYLLQTVGQSVLVRIRQALFEHLMRMEMSYFQRTPLGHIVSRLTNDIEAVTELLSTSIVMVVSNMITLVGLVVAMLLINWRLALLAFSVLPVMAVMSVYFRRKIRAAAARFHRLMAEYQAFLNEQFNGMLVIQLFGREAQSRAEFDVINRGYRDLHLNLRDSFTRFSSALQVLTVFGVALLLYGGGRGVLAEWATQGMLIAFLQYTSLSFEPILQLAEQFAQIQQALSAGERIADVLAMEPGIRSSAEPKELVEFRQTVQFENLSFHYHETTPVLRDINLCIESGQRVAIVGATGAGKTTLASLLARVYDVKGGAIRLDGVDLRELPLEDLPRFVSLVPQNPYIFNGTIADNLRLFDDGISEERMRSAAETACAALFIEQLNDGYEQRLLPGGANLSDGQRQLLALARALIHSPASILILDEATSNIDTETEEYIQRGLEQTLRGRTSITIAHRLSTVREADRILVMHEGGIVEDGPHEELLALGGLYAELYQRQFAEHEAEETELGQEANHAHQRAQHSANTAEQR